MDRKIVALLLILWPGAITASASSLSDISDDIRITKRILTVQIEQLGADHILIADLYHHLARLYESRDEFEQALPHYESALTIYYSELGVGHPKVRELLDHLSSLYSRGSQPATGRGDTAAGGHIDEDIRIARHIYQKQKESLGDTHALLLPLLTERAQLHYRKADYDGARRLYQDLLNIERRTLPRFHPATAETLQMLGDLAHKQGDVASAIEDYTGALAIWRESMPHAYRRIGYCQDKLGFLFYEKDDVPSAVYMARESLEQKRKLLGHILSFSSEEQRLRHTAADQPYALPATAGDAVSLAHAVLLHKGLVLDSIIEDLRLAESSTDPQHQRLLQKRNLAKERLMHLELTDAGAFDDRADKRRRMLIESLQKDIRQTEQQLGYSRSGAHGTNRALKLEPADIQRALDENTVLIEFIRYPHYAGRQRFEEHYGAVIFTLYDGLQWIKLGSAAEIDGHIRRYQRLVRNKDTRDTDLRYNLQRLYNLLWLPIDKALSPQITHTILSPTHRLNFVSFATLLTPRGEFLNEHYRLSYVTSARDLLPEEPLNIRPSLTIFAHPSFGGGGDSAVFKDLPGSLSEAASIKKLADLNGYTVRLFTGEEATEENLKNIAAPAILHIATHGFFAGQPQWRYAALGSSVPLLEDERQQVVAWHSGAVADNPMRDSGLALASAARTIRQWQRGLSEPVRNDGLVTAEEVSLLDLSKTWLVVLSACDTGLGDAQTGEGVFGLRRGFLQAGARNLIMTLWTIPDEDVTPRIVQNIYGRIFQGETPAEALAATQQEWMRNLRQSQGLHAAVKKAGAFIAISQNAAIKQDGE